MCEVLFLYPNGEDNKKQKKDPNYVSFQGNLFKHGTSVFPAPGNAMRNKYA